VTATPTPSELNAERVCFRVDFAQHVGLAERQPGVLQIAHHFRQRHSERVSLSHSE
jgi:hypothetical protein